MVGLVIKGGVVDNRIVIDESLIDLFKQDLGADQILDQSKYNPIPDIGWAYDAGNDAFIAPPPPPEAA